MTEGRTALLSAVRTLADLPEVASAVTEARDACGALRWHQALRRRIPEAAAESRVRGARASAELEGAPYPVDLVREHVVGARPWPDPLGPLEATVKGCVQATAQTEHLAALLLRAPMQAWARLHVAAVAGRLPEHQVGRPREDGDVCRELTDLGPAPSAAMARARLAAVAEVLAVARELPVIVVAGIVHAELLTARPFVAGNGVVARAFERALLRTAGVDPTGVACPEVGHLAGGQAAYLGGLAAYTRGDARGVGLWLVGCAQGVTRGAEEGVRIADAVLAGRLDRG